MRLTSIEYSFKGRKRAHLFTNKFAGHLLVLGPNGSGKSALIEAVEFALGRSTPGRPDLRDQTPTGVELFAELKFELDDGRVATLRRSRGWSKKNEFTKPVVTLSVGGDLLDADAWIAKTFAVQSIGLGWLTLSDAQLRERFLTASRNKAAADGGAARIQTATAAAKAAVEALKSANAVLKARESDVEALKDALGTADARTAVKVARERQDALATAAREPQKHPGAEVAVRFAAATTRLAGAQAVIGDTANLVSTYGEASDEVAVASANLDALRVEANQVAMIRANAASRVLGAMDAVAEVSDLVGECDRNGCCPTCQSPVTGALRERLATMAAKAGMERQAAEDALGVATSQEDEIKQRVAQAEGRLDAAKSVMARWNRRAAAFDQERQAEADMAKARSEWAALGLNGDPDVSAVPAADTAAADAAREAWKSAGREVEAARAELLKSERRDAAVKALEEAKAAAKAAEAHSEKVHGEKAAAIADVEAAVDAGAVALVERCSTIDAASEQFVAYRTGVGFGLLVGSTFIPASGCSTAQRLGISAALDRAWAEVTSPFDALNEVVTVEGDALDEEHLHGLCAALEGVTPLAIVATCHRPEVCPQGWQVIDMNDLED